MATDQSIDEFLTGLGFAHAEARERAWAVLVEAGLTRPGKQRMVATKVGVATSTLRERLIITCAAASCLAEAQREPQRSRVPAADRLACEICSGSNNGRAVDEMVERAGHKGFRRLIVVGGSPATREELAALIHGRLEMKSVDGTQRRTTAQAKEDLAWAQIVVVWNATELGHRVSQLYTHAGAGSARVISAPRRGIAALADAVIRAMG